MGGGDLASGFAKDMPPPSGTLCHFIGAQCVSCWRNPAGPQIPLPPGRFASGASRTRTGDLLGAIQKVVSKPLPYVDVFPSGHDLESLEADGTKL